VVSGGASTHDNAGVQVHDSARLRQVFGAFPSGVTTVGAVIDGVPVAMAASSFTSVSLDPALVSVCIAHTSTTWPTLRGAARLGVSVLGADQEQIARQMASRDLDRFEGVAWSSRESGAVIIDGSSAWLDCTIEDRFLAGDHEIVLLRVVELDADPAIAPLVFHASAFRRLEI
jgi:flavin reductase (DIM6/NTAB) family NADH-FMN oxidoreductase RutF